MVVLERWITNHHHKGVVEKLRQFREALEQAVERAAKAKDVSA